jgi:hypothetical protein
MEKDIIISVPKTSPDLADAIEADSSLNATPLTTAGIDGGSEYLLFLIPFVHYTIKQLIGLLKAHWDSARHVKLEVDGMKIEGAPLDEIAKFLERHQR